MAKEETLENIKEPESIEGLFYFTNRTLENNGYAKAWAYKIKCPQCGTPMQKPRNKFGKPDKKAKYYECPQCGFKMDKKEYESKIELYIKYKCPYCGYEGITIIHGFKRKKVGEKKKGFIFKCNKCEKDIVIEQLKK